MRLVVAVTACAVVLLTSHTALAHGDDRLVSDTLMLGPGETVAFEGDIHYHRLVGRFVADAPVEVRLIQTDTGSTAIDLDPGSDLAVNQLVRCCDGRAWSPHQLVIENTGAGPVTVEAKATLVHDDLAVMVYRAESGTAESVVVMGALWVWALARIRRRKSSTPPARAIRTVGVVLGSVLTLGLYGAVRYRAGSAPGLLAGLADVPVLPFNPIVSRASLLMGLAMIGWAVAGARWAKAGGVMPRRAWVALGVLVVGAVVVTAAAVGTTYQVLGMPLAMALTAAIPVLVFMAVELKRRHVEE
ncbi:MAG TPA: hypothetical protein VIY70_02375 [Acidimicrobiia bacterium]